MRKLISLRDRAKIGKKRKVPYHGLFQIQRSTRLFKAWGPFQEVAALDKCLFSKVFEMFTRVGV